MTDSDSSGEHFIHLISVSIESVPNFSCERNNYYCEKNHQFIVVEIVNILPFIAANTTTTTNIKYNI